jgi:hypothetical protein
MALYLDKIVEGSDGEVRLSKSGGGSRGAAVENKIGLASQSSRWNGKDGITFGTNNQNRLPGRTLR